jgi:hypothetical protein
MLQPIFPGRIGRLGNITLRHLGEGNRLFRRDRLKWTFRPSFYARHGFAHHQDVEEFGEQMLGKNAFCASPA